MADDFESIDSLIAHFGVAEDRPDIPKSPRDTQWEDDPAMIDVANKLQNTIGLSMTGLRIDKAMACLGAAIAANIVAESCHAEGDAKKAEALVQVLCQHVCYWIGRCSRQALIDRGIDNSDRK